MKNLIIFILCLSITNVHGQLNKSIWKSSLCQFGAGFADGANQAYLFHYSKSGLFEKWNIKPNSVAWENKWAKDENGNPIVGQERFWQSSRALVFLTDFHHSTRFATNRLNEGTLLVYAIGHGRKRKKWYWYLADLGIMFTAKSAGFYTSYELIF